MNSAEPSNIDETPYSTLPFMKKAEGLLFSTDLCCTSSQPEVIGTSTAVNPAELAIYSTI